MIQTFSWEVRREMQRVRIEVLLYAILERAILDYLGRGQDTRPYAEKSLRVAARRWIYGRLAREDYDPFTFNWICIHLNLEPNEVRNKIRKLERTTNGSDIIQSGRFAMARVLESVMFDRESRLTGTGGRVYYY